MSQAPIAAQLNLLNAQTNLPLSAAAAVKFAVVVTKWHVRRKTRRQLLTLEPHELADIGLDRATAYVEAAKPFWQD